MYDLDYENNLFVLFWLNCNQIIMDIIGDVDLAIGFMWSKGNCLYYKNRN